DPTVGAVPIGGSTGPPQAAGCSFSGSGPPPTDGRVAAGPPRRPDAESAAAREVPAANRVALPRWVAPVFVLAAAGLVPWTAFLAVSLPHRAEAEHYRLAWVGFDAAMFAVVGALAWIAYR